MTFDDRSTSGKENGKGNDGGGGQGNNGSGSFGITKDAKIPLCVKISFAVPNIANMILVVPVTIMINKYFSDYVGIPMSNLALVTAVARSIDFFIDPVVGWLSDNLSYSLFGTKGRRIPLMVIGAPLSALTFFALFTPPPLANITVLTIWFALFYTVHGWVNCLWHIPYYALGAEIPASYDERTSLYAYLAGGAVVGLILGSTLLPLFLVIAEQAMQLVNEDQIKVVGYYMYITTLA
jgi:GPH family glycoside/pentoside/hexuronide:cation symporter